MFKNNYYWEPMLIGSSFVAFKVLNYNISRLNFTVKMIIWALQFILYDGGASHITKTQLCTF